MTNEQRKAIEFLEFYKQHCLKKEIKNMDNYEIIHDGDFVSKNLDTVLSLIKEQQIYIKKSNDTTEEMNRDIRKLISEIQKKDKQIDLMAEYIATLDIEEDVCANIENDNCDKMALEECEDCIKQYFARKVEDVKG